MLPFYCSLKLFIDQFGATAFSWSCMSGHSDIAKFLIEAGAVVNVVEDVCCIYMYVYTHSENQA